MKISIAMATYNGGKYLREQLGSIRSQTRLPDELIVCDDMSKDDSLEILTEFAGNAPFKVEIIKNEKNLGYAANFAKAISLCSGEVIFLSDQDDVWFSEKIRVVEREFIKHPSVWVVVHDAELSDDNLVKSGVTASDQLIAVGMTADKLILGCCTAFKSIMIPLIIPVPATYGHDGWINNLADALGCRKFIRTALQVYRRHSTNTSNHITTRINLISPFDLLKVRIKDWIKSEGSKGGAAVACETRIMQLEILRCRIVDSESYLREKCDLQSSAARARAEIDRAIAANTVRLDFQRRGALRRVIGATIFYINGGYREFEGWKSFAKDLLR